MSDTTELKVKLVAEDGISAVIDRVVESLGDTKLGHAITSVSTAFTAASHILEGVGHAYEAVHEKVEQAIHAAAEHETSEKKLAAALLVTGNHSEENVISLEKMSASMAKAAGITGEAATSSVALGISLGISNDQIEAASQAAVNLAAVLDVDVNTAMRQVAVTMSGSVGRLGQIIPEIKGFTQSQLQAGAGVQFLADRFKGFAATINDTYEGAVKRANESQHNFIAALGEFITKSTAVRESIAAKAAMYDRLASAIKSVEEFLHRHADTIERVSQGLKSAAIIYGVYFIAVNAVTIATTAATIATSAWAAAMAVALSPITLTIAAVAGLGLALAALGVTTDHVIGVIKILIGVALSPLTASLGLVVAAAGAVVSVFNKDLGTAIQNTAREIAMFGANVGVAGIEQIKHAEAVRKASKEHKDHAANVHEGTIKVTEHEQAMRRLTAEYGRASENAKPAIDALKEFAPKLSLIDWQRDRQNFEAQLDKLKESSTIIIKTIQESGGPQGEGEKAMLARATEDVKRASIAQAAIKIKDFEAIRDAAIKNADVWIEYEKQKAIAASDEIKLKKIAASEEVRAKQIEILTAQMISEQDLHRHYLTVQEESQRRAYDTDLGAYKEMLDAKLALAVDHETNKAIAVDQAGMSVVGLDPVAKAQQQAKLTEDVEAAHQQRLAEALNQGYISQSTYDREYQASRMEQIKAAHAEEVASHQQKAELLGLSEEAVTERKLAAEQEYQDNLQIINEDALLTDAERKAAIEEAELTHSATMNQIREQNITDEMARADKNHDYWQVSLGKIRLEQEKHGKIIGTIKGIQATQEYQAANQALGNLATLQKSHSSKAFAVGQAAAIAQAGINTFMAATAAYAALAGIPIVGPVLGALAAAAAVAAGMMNIQQIKSQKFSAAHGGLDEVPAGLDNSTFLLKGGEGVLQPEANKEVRQAAKTINDGGGKNINVYITVHGDVPDAQIGKVKQAVMDGLRDASERGQQIIHEKGIVRA